MFHQGDSNHMEIQIEFMKYMLRMVLLKLLKEYPDRLKGGWQDQFSLGPGSAVSITFNGNWERHRELWRLVTEEKPWLFWLIIIMCYETVR